MSYTDSVINQFRKYPRWDWGKGWKNILNNLRLILQPFQFFNLIKSGLMVFPIPHLAQGFLTLIALMNHLDGAIPDSIQ